MRNVKAVLTVVLCLVTGIAAVGTPPVAAEGGNCAFTIETIVQDVNVEAPGQPFVYITILQPGYLYTPYFPGCASSFNQQVQDRVTEIARNGVWDTPHTTFYPRGQIVRVRIYEFPN